MLTNLHYHDERCRAEARTREERWAETVTQEKHEWKMPQYSLLNFFSCSLRFLSFIRSQDSIANGALVIARLQLATGRIRPVGRKPEAHNVLAPSQSDEEPESLACGQWLRDILLSPATARDGHDVRVTDRLTAQRPLALRLVKTVCWHPVVVILAIVAVQVTNLKARVSVKGCPTRRLVQLAAATPLASSSIS